MGDNKNLILALVLSAMVLFGWSILFPTSTEDLPAEQPVNEQVVPDAADTVAASTNSPAPPRSLEQALSDDQRVAIETPRLEGSINLVGGRIDDLTLTDHTIALGEESGPVRLLSPARTPEAYFTNFGWTGEGVTVPGADSVWTAEGGPLTPDTPVTLSWDNGEGQTFKLIISVDDNYLFTVDQRVENRGAGAIAVRPFASARRSFDTDERSMWTVHVGPMGVYNNAADYDVGYDDLDDEGRFSYNSRGGWVGFTDKYWLTAVIPSEGQAVNSTLRSVESGGYQADYIAGPMIVAPGTAKTTETDTYKQEWLLLDHDQDCLKIRMDNIRLLDVLTPGARFGRVDFRGGRTPANA